MLNFLFATIETSGELTVFNEIALLIAVGTGIALIMRIFKQPLIIGHIITGIIVGPTLFDLIKSEETITVFANLGIVFLLFIIGLGLNPKVIKEVGKAAAIAGTIQITITSTVGYFVAQILGYSQTASTIIGVSLAFSSTIIILKLISDRKEQTRLYAKISVGILLIQDIVATLALLVLSASGTEEGLDFANIILLIIKALAAILILYVVAEEILPRTKNLIAGSQEFLFLFALGWGLGIASLFEISGFSLEVGALMAGVALSTQEYTQEVSSRLKPLRDFFTVVFFISLGTQLIFDNFFAILRPAIAISAVVIFFNPIVIMTVLGLIGYTRKISYKVGIGMAQISEFSLVFAILAARQGRISTETLSVLTLTGLITIAVSTYLITYSDQIYTYLEVHFRMFENKKIKIDQKDEPTYPVILFGYQKGGAEYVRTFKEMKKKFLIVDYDPQVIDTLERKKYPYVYGDVTDIELLDEIGIDSAKLVITTITEFDTNMFLVTHVHALNPRAVIICHSDSTDDTLKLYEHGASYVIMTHTIGSKQIGSFIKRKGLNKTEFQKFREKHISELVAKAIDANE